MDVRCFRNISQCLVGGIVLCAFQTHGQTVVTDDGFSFSPDPVNIILGASVTWMDDGTGPYQIISDTGAWTTFATPGGILFNRTGTFTYHDDAGDFGTVVVTANIPPSVTITNPASNAVFPAPASFTFSADAVKKSADDITVVRVDSSTV